MTRLPFVDDETTPCPHDQCTATIVHFHSHGADHKPHRPFTHGHGYAPREVMPVRTESA